MKNLLAAIPCCNMVKAITFILAGMMISSLTFSQTTAYPRGGYKDHSELMNKQPSIPFAFTVKTRTKAAKVMGGGAEYRIYCNDGSIEPGEVERQIYAISTGDTLYLNCYLQKAQK